MAISSKLKAFLDGAKVRYTVAKHPVVYTAQEIAASQHVPGRQLAKSVLVKTDQGPVLAVLPAIHLIDLKRLKALLNTKSLSIGKEADIKQHFPDVEVGAMSPFGNIYQVPVAMDRSLEGAEEMVFNGGTHTETIKMRVRNFVSLAKPRLGLFGQPINPPAPPRKKKKSARKSKRAASKRSRPKPKARPKKKGRR